MPTLHSYLKPIEAALKKAGKPAEAKAMSKYMRNKFEHYGVRSPGIRDILANQISDKGLPETMTELDAIVRSGWLHPKREMQFIAMYLLDKSVKVWTGEVAAMQDLFEFTITTGSWWDTVDFLSFNLVFQWWKRNPKVVDEICGKWNQHENFWLNRTSIIYQLKRKKQTDTNLLSKHILRHTDSDEFFIQKAIGWALREYAKTDPKWVINFTKTHSLKPLSEREALKHIKAGRI